MLPVNQLKMKKTLDIAKTNQCLSDFILTDPAHQAFKEAPNV